MCPKEVHVLSAVTNTKGPTWLQNGKKAKKGHQKGKTKQNEENVCLGWAAALSRRISEGAVW